MVLAYDQNGNPSGDPPNATFTYSLASAFSLNIYVKPIEINV